MSLPWLGLSKIAAGARHFGAILARPDDVLEDIYWDRRPQQKRCIAWRIEGSTITSCRTMTADRQYELVLFGATGYTGKLIAEYITQWLPTDLRWAVAGRSEGKLNDIIQNLKSLNADRSQPGMVLGCPLYRSLATCVR